MTQRAWMLIDDYRGSYIWLRCSSGGDAEVTVTVHSDTHPDSALHSKLKYGAPRTLTGSGHDRADAIVRASRLGRTVIDKFLDH